MAYWGWQVARVRCRWEIAFIKFHRISESSSAGLRQSPSASLSWERFQDFKYSICKLQYSKSSPYSSEWNFTSSFGWEARIRRPPNSPFHRLMMPWSLESYASRWSKSKERRFQVESCFSSSLGLYWFLGPDRRYLRYRWIFPSLWPFETSISKSNLYFSKDKSTPNSACLCLSI